MGTNLTYDRKDSSSEKGECHQSCKVRGGVSGRESLVNPRKGFLNFGGKIGKKKKEGGRRDLFKSFPKHIKTTRSGDF